MYRIDFSDLESSGRDRFEWVLIHPTNSCYGFAARIDDEESYKRIYEIKWRQSDKPFFITVSSSDKLKDIAIYDSHIEKYMTLYPETVFTFIMKRSANLASYINPDFETVWIQIASWKLRSICEVLWGAMFGTSANIAGQAAIYESEKIIEQFGNLEQLSFIDAGDLKESPPSTIVDLTQSPPKILRWSLK